MTLYLRDSDVFDLIDMPDAIDAIERVFRSLAAGTALNAPRRRTTFQGAMLNVMWSFDLQMDAIAVKTYPITRQDVTVATSSACLVFRLSTGELRGVLEANRLGQLRTGATSAVAARFLAKPDSSVMTIFGAGWQAEAQLIALCHVLPLQRVHVVARSRERAADFCNKMAESVDATLDVPDSIESAVRESQVVTTATGSTRPVFAGLLLQPGTFVNAIGSNFAEKREIDTDTVARAHIVVDDLKVARRESGDLIQAVTDGVLQWKDVDALADVISGTAVGRESDDDVLVFESQGLSIEDCALAARALDEALRRGHAGALADAGNI